MNTPPQPIPVCHRTCGLVHLLPKIRDYLLVKDLRFPLFNGEVWLGILGIALIAIGLSLHTPEPKCCNDSKNTTASKTSPSHITPPETKATAQTKNTQDVPTDSLTDGISWGLIVWGGWLLLWRLLRASLWSQYYKRGLSGLIRVDLPSPPLLPSQKTFVESMTAQLSSFDLIHPGPLWAIKGGWGSGKSFLMEALHRELEANEQVAVVYIHIWREQTEHDLHLAIVEAILSHPKLLLECFSAYPNSMVLRKIGHFFSRVMPFGMKVANGSLEVLLDPQKALPMIAQQDLEQVVACARRKGLRIVTILDEVDRATIPVAQAAIVLTRRALNLPGLAVVLPYVEGQLRRKVFTPLHDFSPDLHQTFLANLEHQHPITPSESKETEQLAMRLHFAGSNGKDVAEDNHESPRLRKSTHWSLRRELHDEALLRQFWNLNKQNRSRLIEQSEEKYLSKRVNLPRLIDMDIPAVLHFPSVKASLPKDWHPFLPGEKRGLAFGKATTQAPSILLFPGSPPAIRHFEGYLAEYLDQLKYFASPPAANVKPYLILACAVLAWRKAQQLAP